MRGFLLLLALSLARARWALTYWHNFDVSMPNCAVKGVNGLTLEYPELECGSLSRDCYPDACVDVCTADTNCKNIVVRPRIRTCEFRCKEHELDDVDLVPRLHYTVYGLVEEVNIETHISEGTEYTMVDTNASPWAQWLIMAAAALFLFSLIIFYCTEPCTISRSTKREVFGFAPPDRRNSGLSESYQRLEEEQALTSVVVMKTPDRRNSGLSEPASPSSAAKVAAIRAKEEAKAAAAAAKAAAIRAKEDAEAKAKALAEKKAKAEAEAKLKAGMKEKSEAEANFKKSVADAEAKAKAMKEAEKKAKAEADATAKAKAEAGAIKEAEAKLKAAMPYPFKLADPATLRPAIAAAKKAGVSQVAIEAAEVKLKEADEEMAKAIQEKAKATADAKAKAAADAKAKAAADAQAKAAADAKAAKAKAEAEAAAKAKAEAEAKAKAKSPQKLASMTPASLLENDKGRAQLVGDRFTEADSDNSGTLDTDEVIALIGTLCADVGLAPPRDEKVVQLMAMCDADKSGQLDRAEFDKFFKIVLRDAAKRASKLGAQGSLSKIANLPK
jgi:hypothetical protein